MLTFWMDSALMICASSAFTAGAAAPVAGPLRLGIDISALEPSMPASSIAELTVLSADTLRVLAEKVGVSGSTLISLFFFR